MKISRHFPQQFFFSLSKANFKFFIKCWWEKKRWKIQSFVFISSSLTFAIFVVCASFAKSGDFFVNCKVIEFIKMILVIYKIHSTLSNCHHLLTRSSWKILFSFRFSFCRNRLFFCVTFNFSSSVFLHSFIANANELVRKIMCNKVLFPLNFKSCKRNSQNLQNEIVRNTKITRRRILRIINFFHISFQLQNLSNFL